MMMKKFNFTLIAVLLAQVSGCATAPDRIDVVYNDPNAFRSYDCDTLKHEITTLDDIIGREREKLSHKASLDAFQAMASVLTALPVGFGTDGGGRTPEQEIAFGKLKGRAIGMRREALRKNCAGSDPYPNEIQAIESGDYEYKVSNATVKNSLMYPTLKSDEPMSP